MSSIMKVIGPELSELSALELENLPYLTFFTLLSANIDQSVPNLATIYMAIRFQMSLIIGQIEQEHQGLFALEFGKIAEYDFVYTLSSTNINQPAPNLVKVYMTIGSQMRLIMELIGPELSELSALDLENVPYLPFVYTLASANIDQSILNLATTYMPIRSRMSLWVKLYMNIRSSLPLNLEKLLDITVYSLSSTNIG